MSLPNRIVDQGRDHYRVEDPRAKDLWDADDPRDDAVLCSLVRGWVFMDVHGDWVAMTFPRGDCERYKRKDEAFAHFGVYTTN